MPIYKYIVVVIGMYEQLLCAIVAEHTVLAEAKMSRNNNQKLTGFATRAIHHGYEPLDEHGALAPPLHLTSTYVFENAQAGGEMFAGEREGHIYSRISNPTCDLLEKRIAVLEGAEAGLALASGMGAITSVMWTFLKPGDEVIADKTLYGCTFAFLNHGLGKYGVKVTHVDLTDLAKLTEAISDQTKVVFFETPANPNMRLVDIEAVSNIARKFGARTVVDNTYATPVITRPIEMGADIVVHSATKYLGGHGDLIAGLAVGTAEDMMDVRCYGMKDMTGAVMSPFTAMLVMRGMKTLQLRVERHCKSAMSIARTLEDHPAVESIYYPGLESFPQFGLAQRQMADFGGMIALELKGGYEAGIAMINRLSLIRCAVSLGDAESLIQHPASMTHSNYTEEERAVHGISDGLIRLSVGLEDEADILDDLHNALNISVAAVA
jgi:methionine-gamma-lyase